MHNVTMVNDQINVIMVNDQINVMMVNDQITEVLYTKCTFYIAVKTLYAFAQNN